MNRSAQSCRFLVESYFFAPGYPERYPPFSTRNETTILNLLPALANPLRRVG